MSCLLTSNNKGSRFSTNNNKDIQKTPPKQLPSYNGVIKALNIRNSLIFGPSTVDIHSCKSKRTTRNKDKPTTTINAAIKKQINSNPLIPVILTKSIYSCKSKCANIKNNDNK